MSLKTYRPHVLLGPDYTGQPGALSAVVEDAYGVIVATLNAFTEIGSGTGEYETAIDLDTALSARYRYTWVGYPAKDFIESDIKLPTGLPANTPYAYPATLSLGPDYSGQAGAVQARFEDAAGTVLATVLVFTEIGDGTGEYGASPLLSSSQDGLMRYFWGGVPDIVVIEPDEVPVAAGTGSDVAQTLTNLDLENTQVAVQAALSAQGLTPDLIRRLNYLQPPPRTALPTAGSPAIALPNVTPGSDTVVHPPFPLYLTAGKTLVSAKMGFTWNGLPIAGIADRQITPTTDARMVGQITNQGLRQPDGSVLVDLIFTYTRDETALFPPGVALWYWMSYVDSDDEEVTFAVGPWVTTPGGPLGF